LTIVDWYAKPQKQIRQQPNLKSSGADEQVAAVRDIIEHSIAISSQVCAPIELETDVRVNIR